MMTNADDSSAPGGQMGARLVPVSLGEHTVYVSVSAQRSLSSREPGDEQEISSHTKTPKLEQVLDGLAVFAVEIAERLKGTDASRIGVQFGCDIAVESGTVVAVFGKASASSSISVSLEWTGTGSQQ
jgi:hypothetical protein